jgi:small-conductance mechanosensitive channel
LGLVTAGLAIALQDPLSNLAGWLFIVTRRPYSVGDRIEIAGQIGDVIDIRLFQTYLMECGNWVGSDQATGRVLGIPNGMVFKSTSANYTSGFEYIWDEIPVLVTFESDWRKAKRLLEGIAESVAQPMSADSQRQIRRAASKQMIFFQKLTPIIYTSVQDSGVLLTMRYLTPPRQRRGNAQLIWEAILDAYAHETDIDFAYPTMRQFRNITEGKPGTRPEPI